MAQANADAVGLDVALGVEEAFHGVLAGQGGARRHARTRYKRAVTHRDYAQAGVQERHAAADRSDARAGRRRRAAGAAAFRRRAGSRRRAPRSPRRWDPTSSRSTPRDTPPDLSAAPAFAEAMRTAAQRNPAIIAALARLDAQHAAVSAVTRELLPNLFASASLTGRAGGAAPSSGDTPYGGGWLPDVANWHVGLVLQWNLFDATVLARRAAAKAHEDAARADLDLARMNVGLAAERAYLDLDAALKTLPGLQAAVDAARANQAQADARFKAGLGTIVELADAEALLTNSQLELAVGQFTVARARATLGRVMAQSLRSSQPMTTGNDDMKPSLQPHLDRSHPPERAQLGGDVAPSVTTGGAGAGGGRVRVVVLAGVGVVLVAHDRDVPARRVAHQPRRAVAVGQAGRRSRRPRRRPSARCARTSARRRRGTAARVGPQYVSAYVGTVLVRPGAVVKRGEVLATLDCRNASAASREIAARAHAIEERQIGDPARGASAPRRCSKAASPRPNELEQLTAKSASEKAEAESMRASLVSRSLEVDDCILRAPFAGEVAERFVDPGAYVRPGNPVVDASSIATRCASSPTRPSRTSRSSRRARRSTSRSRRRGAKLKAAISRRAPAADEATRTVHFEIDVRQRRPRAAGRLDRASDHRRRRSRSRRPRCRCAPPRSAATRRPSSPCEGDVAKSEVVHGARRGGRHARSSIRKLKAGTPVVVEGRALLDDGDKVVGQGARSCDRARAAQSDRGADDLHRPDGVRRRGHAAHERRHLPRADAAGARRRHAGARPRPEGRREDDHLAPREVRQRHAGRRSRRVASSRNGLSIIYVWLKWGTDLNSAQTLVQQQTRVRHGGDPEVARRPAAVRACSTIRRTRRWCRSPSPAAACRGRSSTTTRSTTSSRCSKASPASPRRRSTAAGSGRSTSSSIRCKAAARHLTSRRRRRRRWRSRTRSCRRASSSPRSSTPTSTPTPCRPTVTSIGEAVIKSARRPARCSSATSRASRTAARPRRSRCRSTARTRSTSTCCASPAATRSRSSTRQEDRRRARRTCRRASRSRPIFDQSTFVRTAYFGLKKEIVQALILIAIVILIFLQSDRAARSSSSVAIPLSFAITLIVLYAQGQTLNAFTLGGLTLAMGRLVDDAVVVLESIHRHQQQGHVASPRRRCTAPTRSRCRCWPRR